MTTKWYYFVWNPWWPELIDSHTEPAKLIAEEIESIKSRMSFIRSANVVSSSVEKTLKSM